MFMRTLLLTLMTALVLCIIVLSSISCGQTAHRQPDQPHSTATVPATDTCDNPDANIDCCFIGMPADLTNVIAIADSNEPGERLVISGTFYKNDGRTPYPDVIIYAYHTDNRGEYSKRGDEHGVQKWHGHLHGWGKTDREGHYEIRTIRPARYPDNTIPAHIHVAIREPNGNSQYYINDFVFADDSLVNKQYLNSISGHPGGTGVVELQRTAVKFKENVLWSGRRDIVLSN
jgi:protocatechuate 3,4-dioxygenase beta subunit